jgi:hypothetical protein
MLASTQLRVVQLLNANFAQPQPNRPGGTDASKVRMGQPSMAAVNSSLAVCTSTAPALRAICSKSSGSKVCRSTTASSAAARDDSSSSACGLRQFSNPGSLVTLVAMRQVNVDRLRA